MRQATLMSFEHASGYVVHLDPDLIEDVGPAGLDRGTTVRLSDGCVLHLREQPDVVRRRLGTGLVASRRAA